MPAPNTETIARLVHAVRGERVLFDADLASLYGVSTKVLNQAVKRNSDRFPADFMFRLTAQEWKAIRSQSVTASVAGTNWSQIVTSSSKHRGGVYQPYAFTEQGVAMLSKRAAFVPGRGGEHRHHAHVRPAAPPDGFQSTTRA